MARAGRRLAVLLGVLAIAAAGEPPTRSEGLDPIPPRPSLKLETVPPSPGVSYSWLPGRWNWDGAKWNWAKGHYHVTRPGPFRYELGHAEGQGAVQSYVPGHFVAPPPDSSRGDIPLNQAQLQNTPLQH